MSNLMQLELTPEKADKAKKDLIVDGGKLSPNRLRVTEDGVVEIKARSTFMAVTFIAGSLLILIMVGLVIMSLVNGSMKDTGTAIGIGVVALIFIGCGFAAVSTAVGETNVLIDVNTKSITLSRLFGRNQETIGVDGFKDVVVILSASPKGCVSWLRLEKSEKLQKSKHDVIDVNTKNVTDDKRAIGLIQLACLISSRLNVPLRIDILAVDGLDIMSRPLVAEFLKSLPKPKVTRPQA